MQVVKSKIVQFVLAVVITFIVLLITAPLRFRGDFELDVFVSTLSIFIVAFLFQRYIKPFTIILFLLAIIFVYLVVTINDSTQMSYGESAFIDIGFFHYVFWAISGFLGQYLSKFKSKAALTYCVLFLILLGWYNAWGFQKWSSYISDRDLTEIKNETNINLKSQNQTTISIKEISTKSEITIFDFWYQQCAPC